MRLVLPAGGPHYLPGTLMKKKNKGKGKSFKWEKTICLIEKKATIKKSFASGGGGKKRKGGGRGFTAQQNNQVLRKEKDPQWGCKHRRQRLRPAGLST